MTKIDIDMKYILELYFSKEHEISITAEYPLVPDSAEIEHKIENIARFGDNRRKILAVKLLKLLEMASCEFAKEVDKEA